LTWVSMSFVMPWEWSSEATTWRILLWQNEAWITLHPYWSWQREMTLEVRNSTIVSESEVEVWMIFWMM